MTKIVGLLIGLLIFGFGLYYLIIVSAEDKFISDIETGTFSPLLLLCIPCSMTSILSLTWKRYVPHVIMLVRNTGDENSHADTKILDSGYNSRKEYGR